MSLNIKIDFNKRYEALVHDKDLRFATFDTILVNGSIEKIGIKISFDEHPLMPDVYNLAFGPVNEQLEIDDYARLHHQDHSKVFSTVVFAALSFLTLHKRKFLGIDGSTTARAYMYYRCIQNNFEYLSSFFDLYGINYYLRVLRDGSEDYDQQDFLATPMPIIKGETLLPQKLFNYFIFKIKDGSI